VAVTTTTNVDPEVDKYFDKVLLDREEAFFCFMLFAQNRMLPEKNSKTVTFRRFDNLTVASSPLPENYNPPFETVTKFDIDATIALYGNVVALTDDVVVYVQDETSNEVADMLSYNMFETMDSITRDVIVARRCGHVKPNLIDLEAYGGSYGDRGEPGWDAERLSGLAA